MKQALAIALVGLENLNEGVHERPVDRLHALGAAQQPAHFDQQRKVWIDASRQSALASLGRDLMAFKLAHRAESHWPAITALADVLGWDSLRLNLRSWNRSKVARWAIHEWAFDFCPSCTGKGHVPDHDIPNLEGPQPMKPCGTCHGTGIRRYSDQERMKELGDDPRLTGEGMDVAHMMIGEAERQAVRMANILLEKWR